MVVLLAAAHPAVRVPQKLRVPNGKIFDLTFQSVHFLGATKPTTTGSPPILSGFHSSPRSTHDHRVRITQTTRGRQHLRG